MDELAEKIGCDPVEFRLRNLAESGESIHPGMRPIDADVPGDVREAARLLHAGAARARARALGVLLGERCGRASGDAGDGAGVRRRLGIGA